MRSSPGPEYTRVDIRRSLETVLLSGFAVGMTNKSSARSRPCPPEQVINVVEQG